MCTNPETTHLTAGLVPFVQRADNSVQWINRHPADKMYSNQYVHFIRWIATYPLDKVIRSLNNRGLEFKKKTGTVTGW